MGTKSREVIWGGQIMGAKIRARGAREAAQKAAREADRAEAYPQKGHSHLSNKNRTRRAVSVLLGTVGSRW